MKRSIQIILSIVLAIGLVACGGRYSVPGTVLKKAIAISVDQTQQEISQQLKLTSAPKVTVDRVKITDQSPLKIEGTDGYHVKGVYDFTLKLSSVKINKRITRSICICNARPRAKRRLGA